jgi:hypothetical protein
MKIQPGVGYNFDSSSHGFTLDTSDPFPSRDGGGDVCLPLKVKYLGYTPSPDDTHTFNVCVGTVNNLVPQLKEDGVWVKLDRVVSGAASPPVCVMNFTGGYTWIYLRVGKDAGSPALDQFPAQDTGQDGYPKIDSYGSVQTDNDTYAYLLLAHGFANAENVLTLYIDVQNSLWTERFKCGTDNAIYWWSAV